MTQPAKRSPRKKPARAGRVSAPPRSGAWIEMPESLKERLKAQAAYETSVHPLGNNVSIRDLSVAILDEGLKAREAKRAPSALVSADR